MTLVHLALGWLALVAGTQPATPPTPAARIPSAGERVDCARASVASVDFSRERALIEEAETALESFELGRAREMVGEAVTLLLARAGAERDATWLALLDRAGGAAFYAEDAETAKSAWQQVLEVRLATLPDDHTELQEARGNVALAIKGLGDLTGARALEEKVLEVFSRTLPDEHPNLQLVRENLAGTVYALGDFAAAHALFEQVLEVRSRTLPDDHPDLGRLRTNLAAVKLSLGDLTGARTLLEKVLATLSRTLPDDHPYLQSTRHNLAGTLHSLGDLPASRVLFEKVLEVLSRTLPDDHPDLQSARLNLSITIYALGDLTGARALQEKVLEIRLASLPDDHPDLQVARGNLALTIKALGDVAGARALEEKVLEVRTATLPDEHPDLQVARGNLALTLKTLGDWAGARALEEKVLEIRSATLQADQTHLRLARENLAWTIAHQAARARDAGEAPAPAAAREQCFALIEAVCRTQTGAARAAVLEGSPREAQARCEELSPSVAIGLAFAAGLGVFEASPELELASFELSETTRGAAMGSAALMRYASDSPRYSELRAELQRRSAELVALAQQGATSTNFQQARARREAIEVELVTLARELSGDHLPWLDFDLHTLASKLGERDALVAYRSYDRWSLASSQENDEVPYAGFSTETAVESLCAFVVRPASERSQEGSVRGVLTRVELGPLEPIELAVREWRASLGLGADVRGIGAVTAHAGEDLPRGEELRRLVFDPLLRELSGADHCVFVFDDVLHLVPLDALPAGPLAAGEEQALLGDVLRIETRLTAAELLASAEGAMEGEDLVVVGGVAYGTAEDSASETAAGPALSPADNGADSASIPRGAAWSGGFDDLPATRAEVQAIAEEFEQSHAESAEVVLLEEHRATREKLLEAAPAARWLHVATHGWFAPESVKSWEDPEPIDRLSGLGLRLSGEEQIKGMSPMLLCGLALAGANLPADELGRAQGLLTAEELAALDLSRCELAVLSACDTNVGERRAGQGVASLQRALQMAGARSVITSLWMVPDEATKELMLDFYRRLWFEKKPKHQALWEAKLVLRHAVDERGRPLYATRDWAAWVLTGEPD